MSNIDGCDMSIKFLVIGDANSGKSVLLLRFADDSYTESYVSTIGVDFKIRIVEAKGKQVKLQIWDTAGQERFRTITASYYRGTQGVMIVFDVCSQKSYSEVLYWLHEVDKYASENVNRIIVGNNCEKVAERVIEYKAAKEFCDGLGIPYIECSAKNGTNIEKAFMTLTEDVVERLLEEPAQLQPSFAVITPPKNAPAKKRSSFC